MRYVSDQDVNDVEDGRAAQGKWEVGWGGMEKRNCSSQERNGNPHKVETSGGKRRGGVGENCRGCGDDCTIQQRSVCACECACTRVQYSQKRREGGKEKGKRKR